jgi:carboxyl-terminal processing protease
MFTHLWPAGAETKVSEAISADSGEKAENRSRYENLALFNKVLHFVEQNYVEEVPDKELIQGALQGMLSNLDPHSNLLVGDTYREMKIDTSGQFGGIGIELTMKDGVLTVVTPIDGTPAYKAGILAGDRIVKINGFGTKGMTLADAITRMRGNKGSVIRLTIWRKGFQGPKEFAIKRGDVKIQTVKSEVIEPGYLYLRLAGFNERAAKELKQALDEAERKEGKSLLRGVILDLRNNPGGLLDQAVEVASLFVPDGVIVSTKGRNPQLQETKYALPGMARTYMPMAVLVNGASASAAEIVAGALQDHKRAVIMGQTTFGKGSVQNVVEVGPDLGLKLTVAKYYTPKGRSIQAVGIRPDVVLDDLDQKVIEMATKKKEVRQEKDLEKHIAAEESNFSNDELNALDRAEAKPAQAAEPADQLASKQIDEAGRHLKAIDDYQVKQALNYMKSYQVLRAMNLSPKDDGPSLDRGVKKAQAE